MSVDTISSQKTIQQIIDESTASKTNERNTGELGKTDFLNLLVTQLQYQDPLNPTDDKAFIGQMAQFSALEQMQNLNTSFSSTKAFGLIGKNVTASVADATTGESKAVNGDVTNVKLSEGKAYVVVNGTDIAIEDITDVAEGYRSSQGNISAYTSLIGTTVDGIAYNGTNGDMIQVSGKVSAIKKGVYEDYAVLDGAQVEIASINSGINTTDADYIRRTLEDARDNGKEISIIIKDSTTGISVPVTAKIASLDFTGGTIKATLNGLTIPVEGVTTITKPETSQAGGTSGS